MIVVAGTSPLNYLILIGAVDVLAHLYTRDETTRFPAIRHSF